MKNKFLIGTITVFVAIFVSILVLNFTNSSSNKDNYFDRKFSEDKILKFDRKFDKLNKNSVYDLFYSNTSIIEGKLENTKNKENNYNFYFSDDSIFNKNRKSAKLPIDSNILLVDKYCAIYSYKKRLYKLDFETNTTTETKIKNVDISFLISLDNLQNKYLFFGEIYENNNYKTGFFILDIVNNKIMESKLLQSNLKSFKPELVTMYFGYFQKMNNNSITYTCERNSEIFLFDKNGLFENKLQTKDNTPMPKVIKNSNGDCFYSRAGLRFTNSYLFMDEESIFVFSMASNFNDKIIIDEYSKSTMKYIQSYKLDYNNYNSKDIVNVIINKDKIILKFEFNYASFTFSRYNN